jgi:acetyl-CoA carboxylase biotin carboxyl carrier protein
MHLDTKTLRGLLRLLAEGDVSSFSYEDADIKMKIVRGRVAETKATSRDSSAGDEASTSRGQTSRKELDVHFITSPFVGTFYRAASPSAPPFVEAGSRVMKGQTLCIVEAMKLMNEIEADGTYSIEQILVENATAVEFGQPLFKVRVV